MSSDIVCIWSRSEPLLSTTLYFGQTCRTMVLDQKHPHGYSLWLLAAYDDVKMLIDRLNVSSQPHSSSRLFCYAGSLSKGSDVGLVYPENMLSEVMDFDHTFLWTPTYWYPIENDRLNASSQPHSSSRLFCYAGSLSKGSDVGLVYPENMSEVAS
ncbi:hypothetical protein DY000_02025575 [Brassica cretica]|uniref:Uncharacterized protein n=1 Tax=Brassica cretica TaxID=69181 RepID=A0ABQ7EG12_BRACR|nr:hypothetical protein DY000_02025575 [Brassica cretica]